jgi:hypothetical protein
LLRDEPEAICGRLYIDHYIVVLIIDRSVSTARVSGHTEALAPADSKHLVDNLQIAFELHEAGVALMRQNLRRRMPHASEEEIDAHLASCLREQPGAELGDAEGRAVPWPRPAP